MGGAAVRHLEPAESAEELLTAILGQDESLEPLKRELIERTEGNPFFFEEAVQTLVETTALHPLPDTCQKIKRDRSSS
jgi:predicted ATPase